MIQYKPKLASWDYKEISGAITTFYDIRGLTPYTEYEFVVLAVNNVGRGDKSMPVVTTTGETGIFEGCFVLDVEMKVKGFSILSNKRCEWYLGLHFD